LATADLFLMPTLSEGMSLAAVEAMCSGLPLVISKFSGVDCFVDGEMGVLIEDNVESVEGGISRALADQAQLDRWGRNARAAASGLSWERYEREISSLAARVSVNRGQRP
jgi:glycosyltransferase involved in cell wall biosynthesis